MERFKRSYILFQLLTCYRAALILIPGGYVTVAPLIDFNDLGSLTYHIYMIVDLIFQFNQFLIVASNMVDIMVGNVQLKRIMCASLRPYRNQNSLPELFEIRASHMCWFDEDHNESEIAEWRLCSGDTWLVDGEGTQATTFMRTLAGLLPMHRGQILLNGKVAHSGWEELRNVTLYATTDAPLPRGTVSESFTLLERDGECDVDDDIMSRCLDTVELNGKLDNDVVTLSGGEKSRLHIARNLYRAHRSLSTPYPVRLLLLCDIDRGIDSARAVRIVERILTNLHVTTIAIAHKSDVRSLFKQQLQL
jgi:ABC-type iron transport system FetAB ATPase subunit